MEARIKERYNQTILDEALRRYGIEQADIRVLDGFESFIYECDRDSDSLVLRIGHSFRRSEGLVRAEVEWINYLAAGGVSVAKAIPSENGRLVERIDDCKGGYFVAVAFEKAGGKHLSESEWTTELFETYGKLVGRMHSLTKGYSPSNTDAKRPQWEDATVQEVESFLPPSEAVAAEKYRRLVEYVSSLPRDEQSYGLIHFDAHAANFFVNDAGNINLFDFDDCCYSWFVYDIAIVLFYKVMGVENVSEYTQDFLTHFLRGYKQENLLEARWLTEIPYFLKLREIDLYAVIHRSFDVNDMDDPWNNRYMKDRKYKIENDVPYIDFDFDAFAASLSSG